jgi:hypothetical protein
MSADNWATCPQCEENHRLELAKLDKQIAEAYGSIPVTAFDDLRNRRTVMTGELPNTLREDYEIGIYKGVFECSYTAFCEACGFHYEFTTGPTAIPLKEQETNAK